MPEESGNLCEKLGGENTVEEGDVPGAGEYRPMTVREIAILVIFFGAFIFFAAGGPTLGLGMTQLGSIMLPVASSKVSLRTTILMRP